MAVSNGERSAAADDVTTREQFNDAGGWVDRTRLHGSVPFEHGLLWCCVIVLSAVRYGSVPDPNERCTRCLLTVTASIDGWRDCRGECRLSSVPSLHRTVVSLRDGRLADLPA